MIKLNGQKKVMRQAVSQLSFDHTVCHIAYCMSHTTENPSSVEESSNVYELSLIDCSDKKSIKQTLEASMHCDCKYMTHYVDI